MDKMKRFIDCLKRGIRKAVCFCLGSFFVFSYLFSTFTEQIHAAHGENKSQTVRIGYFLDNDHFQEGAEGERKSGYAYEYYQKIAECTGWDYEYVYGTWSELEEKLRQGEIDMMAGFSITPERQDVLLFSEKPMGMESYYIYAPLESTQIQSRDLSTLNGKKIGVTRGTVMVDMLQDYLTEMGLDSEVVQKEDFDGMHEAMKKGELDACILSDNFVVEQVGQIACIGNSELYFAVNPERSDLLEQLNTAMERLWEISPYYTVLLQDKYFSGGLRQTLTEEERSWLAEKGQLRFGYMVDALPISGQKKDGSPAGLTELVWQSMEEFLGIQVVPIGYDNMDEMEEALQTNELDAAFPLYCDLWRSESKGIYQTDSIVKDRVMLVFQGIYEETLYDEIALCDQSIGQKYYVEDKYPNAQVISYDDLEVCLEAVRTGKTRCSIGCESVMQREMQENPEYAELNIAYLDDTEDFGLAVNGQEHLLVEMLNKMIAQMDEADITNAMIQYSYVQNDYSLSKYMEEHAVWFICGLAVVASVMIGIFIAYRKNAKYNQRMLREAAIKASEANQAKTRFLSTMSHDIRTPMNVIMGMTSIASKHMDDPVRVQNCLQNITQAGHHLLTLINDILDISKLESGRTFLNPTRFSLHKMAEEICSNIGFHAREKAVDFHMELTDIICDELYADELRLNQIFINLLSNAVKYTQPHGRVEFLIHQEEVEDVKDRIRLVCRVKDTGIGMSEKFMESMYEPFAREENSRVNEIQGYGLGLAIIHQMVELMGGEISCQSQKGVGTTFTVLLELPMAKQRKQRVQESVDSGEKVQCMVGGEAEKAQPQCLESRINPKESAWDGENPRNVTQLLESPTNQTVTEVETWDKVTGKKVLVAEDNELNWEIMQELLEDYDIYSERAENGQICLDMLKEKPAGTYVAILMDIQMPLLDGRETTRRIRALSDPGKAHIPIVAMTADAFAEDVSSCLACGMDGHIAKPVNEKLLIGILRQVCE